MNSECRKDIGTWIEDEICLRQLAIFILTLILEHEKNTRRGP
jgi:hypothetical protein